MVFFCKELVLFYFYKELIKTGGMVTVNVSYV